MHRIETLQNGLIRVDHRPSGLVSLYNPDGSHRHGPQSIVAGLLVREHLSARRQGVQRLLDASR